MSASHDEILEYQEKLPSFQSAYECSLNNFKHYYVLTRIYPNDPQYKEKYNDAKKHLAQLANTLFLMNNEVQKRVDVVEAEAGLVDTSVKKRDEKHNVLLDKHKVAYSGVNGSIQMASDFQTLYTNQYVTNISFIIGILLSFGATYVVFRKPSVPQ